jgi:hypothetical protein
MLLIYIRTCNVFLTTVPERILTHITRRVDSKNNKEHAWDHAMNLYPIWIAINLGMEKFQDRLCGLVVRVLGYRSGGPGSIPGTNRKKNLVGLERGALSLVSTNW